jgi:hypothetical protein
MPRKATASTLFMLLAIVVATTVVGAAESLRASAPPCADGTWRCHAAPWSETALIDNGARQPRAWMAHPRPALAPFGCLADPYVEPIGGRGRSRFAGAVRHGLPLRAVSCPDSHLDFAAPGSILNHTVDNAILRTPALSARFQRAPPRSLRQPLIA